MNTSELKTVLFDKDSVQSLLENTSVPLICVKDENRYGLFPGKMSEVPSSVQAVAVLPKLSAERLGDRSFCEDYRTRYAYMTGAMANAIASAEMVIAVGKAGLLGCYGAGGVLSSRVEKDVMRIKNALGEQPFAVNLIHSPSEPKMEQDCIDVLIKHEVKVIEASAFMNLTLPLVEYRVKGLYRSDDGRVHCDHKIIAKLSRKEVAEKFLSPPPMEMVDKLLQDGRISAEQAELSQHLGMADDVTAEADSGGHTDRRPLTALLPMLIQLRDRMQEKYGYLENVRIGAAGGIGTPDAALGAFAMGAAYIVTGSVNQCCIESGSSSLVRELLAKADVTDVGMAPAADMFEMGVKLQVLKRGTLFSMRANLLYELYSNYDSLESIPDEIRENLEKKVFRKTIEEVWTDTKSYFEQRDPEQIKRAQQDSKSKMALVFRSYLGQSSLWANAGDPDRKIDYQIWTGPSMGAFNSWVRGSYLEDVENRKVAVVAEHIMQGCAFLQRLHLLKLQGVSLSGCSARNVSRSDNEILH